MDLQTAGHFWVPGYPAITARGDLTAQPGAKPEVRLASGLVDDPLIRAAAGGFAFSGGAVDSVAAFQPITLHGQLDSGVAVTVQHAQNYGSNPPFGTPRYVAFNVVVGDLVTGLDQSYKSVRFRLGHPYWLAHLREGEPVVVEDDGSTLSVEAAEDGNWLVYTSSAPATLRQLEIRVVSGCLVLLHLALEHDRITTRETQVRLDGDHPWLPVCGPAFNAPLDPREADSLLPRDVLTVERFAKWIALNDKFDGLAWAVARPFKAELQPQVQVMTSLVEGLHRRLPYEQRKFPGASKDAMGAVLKAARSSASAEAVAQGVDPEVASSSVVLFHDVSFRTRASDIVTEVCAVIPEITESILDLPRRIVDARNDFAHQLQQGGESLSVRILPWLIVARTVPWLLRGLLLLRAGIDPNVLHDGYLASNRFDHFRANTAQHVRELGWKVPDN